MLKFVFQNYLKDEYQELDKDSNLEDDYYLDDYKDLKKEDIDHSQRNNKFVLSVTNHIHYTGKENNNLKDDYGFFIDFETMEREVPFIKKRIQTIPMSGHTSSTHISNENSKTTSKEYVQQSDDEKKKPYDKKPEILFLCLTTMSIVIILTFS